MIGCHSATYEELVSAINRVHLAYIAMNDEDPLKDNLRFQYQALLEKEEKYLGLESAPTEEEVKPKKKRKMSAAAREKMSKLMKDRQADLKAAKANKKVA